MLDSMPHTGTDHSQIWFQPAKDSEAQPLRSVNLSLCDWKPCYVEGLNSTSGPVHYISAKEATAASAAA